MKEDQTKEQGAMENENEKKNATLGVTKYGTREDDKTEEKTTNDDDEPPEYITGTRVNKKLQAESIHVIREVLRKTDKEEGSVS